MLVIAYIPNRASGDGRFGGVGVGCRGVHPEQFEMMAVGVGDASTVHEAVVLDGSGTVEELRAQVDRLWARISADLGGSRP